MSSNASMRAMERVQQSELLADGSADIDDGWVSVTEAATLLGVTVGRVRQLLRKQDGTGLVGKRDGKCPHGGAPPWAWVSMDSIRAYEVYRANAMVRIKASQRRTFDARKGSQGNGIPCPRCEILTPEGELCEQCRQELDRHACQPLGGRPLIPNIYIPCPTVAPDAWRGGRLVMAP